MSFGFLILQLGLFQREEVDSSSPAPVAAGAEMLVGSFGGEVAAAEDEPPC